MGPVLAAVQIAGIIVGAGALGQTITIQVLQSQIQDSINAHKKQFQAIKDIQVFLQSFLKPQDFKNLQESQKKYIAQNIHQISKMLSIQKQNLAKVVDNYPDELSGFMLPTQDDKQKIVKTFNPLNLDNAKYLASKSSSKKKFAFFKTIALGVASGLQGIDWKKLAQTLQQPVIFAAQLGISITNLSVKGFFSQIASISTLEILGSIVSVIGLAFSVYSVIQNVSEIKKLVSKKDQIQKQLKKLPETQKELLKVSKSVIRDFLVYVVISGSFIQDMEQIVRFVALFSDDDDLKNQISSSLSSIPENQNLISNNQIKILTAYAEKSNSLFHNSENNVKQNTFKLEQLYQHLFNEIDISGIHKRINSTFTHLNKTFLHCIKQSQKLKYVNNYFKDVYSIFKNKTDDKMSAILLEQIYKTKFSKNILDQSDKIIIVKCLASIKDKFYADDPTGMTYLGIQIQKYKNHTTSYRQIGQRKFNQQDVTQYQKQWTNYYMKTIKKILKENFPKQEDFSYRKTKLHYQTTNTLQNLSLQVKRRLIFIGSTGQQYYVQCQLSQKPKFRVFLKSLQLQFQRSSKLAKKSTLVSGQQLNQSEELQNNYGYIAHLSKDGSLNVYEGYSKSLKNIVWSSNSTIISGNSPFKLSVTANGNLNIEDKYRSIWNTNLKIVNRQIMAPFSLHLQKNGQLVLKNSNYQIYWTSKNQKFGKDKLKSGSVLTVGQYLQSTNKQNNMTYKAIVQEAKFFIQGSGIQGKKTVWSAKIPSKGKSPYKLVFHTDGNLIYYDSQLQELWKTNIIKKSFPPYTLMLKKQGQLVIVDKDKTQVWNSSIKE